MGTRPAASTATAGTAASGGNACPLRAAGVCRATLIGLVALLAAPASAAADPPAVPLAQFPHATLTVESRGTVHPFRVYLATTEAQHQQGLMYVRQLAPDRGMLFLFDTPQVASFWMKNTLIPLDLLFIAPDGRIIRIAENATPLSLATINSMGIVSSVLEVAGGTSRRLGIAAGDRIRYGAVTGH